MSFIDLKGTTIHAILTAQGTRRLENVKRLMEDRPILTYLELCELHPVVYPQ